MTEGNIGVMHARRNVCTSSRFGGYGPTDPDRAGTSLINCWNQTLSAHRIQLSKLLTVGTAHYHRKNKINYKTVTYEFGTVYALLLAHRYEIGADKTVEWRSALQKK